MMGMFMLSGYILDWLREGILFFMGLCGGGVVAAGLFSFVVSIGALNRIIGKTHTGNHITLYEYCIVAGVTLGNLVNLYEPDLIGWFPAWEGLILIVLFGLCAGIFVGVLVMSLAETLNALPVFARNLHIMTGMKYVVFSLAAGKGAGAWLDFLMGMK